MKRPLSVTLIALLFIAAGVAGVVFHFSDDRHDPWIIVIFIIRLIAIIGGVFLLKGHNWARWLVLAWMAFHVVVSGFHALPEFLMHAFLLIVIAFILLRPPASDYFRSAPSTL